ncbi:Orn/Lys/Arg family decarboxylase [Streptomyces xanthochromogenes]
MDFKALHDTETPLRQVLPRLVERHPKRYGRLTLRGLSQEMHEHLTDADLIDALDTAFQDLPNPVVPPQRCYQQLIWGGTERLRLTHAAGRVAAAVVTVTPAGIPVLMPGEALGAPDGPVLRYLGALEAFDRAFPGFHNEAHGVVIDADTGDYLIECVREEIARPSETPDAVAPT